MKIRLTLFFLLIAFGYTSAASTEQTAIYNAYTSSNMTLWKKTMDSMHDRLAKRMKMSWNCSTTNTVISAGVLATKKPLKPENT